MPIELDHIILAVNDREASIAFYTTILGLTYAGDDGPFSTLRVTPRFMIQIAPWGTSGGEHLAFAMSRIEFDDAFTRIREAGMPYGDAFSAVGNMRGPGEESGSQGMGQVVYVFDPNKHLIEIRHYAAT